MLIAAVTSLSGCGGDDTVTPVGDGGSSDGTTSDATSGGDSASSLCISGTVTHEGSHGGSLRLGAFKVFPPQGPPDGIGYVQHPSFPQAFSITVPSAGSYTIGCYLDVNDSDPVSPGASDFSSQPTPVTVNGSGGCATVTLDIEEGDAGPLPSDGGGDSSG